MLQFLQEGSVIDEQEISRSVSCDTDRSYEEYSFSAQHIEANRSWYDDCDINNVWVDRWTTSDDKLSSNEDVGESKCKSHEGVVKNWTLEQIYELDIDV